MIQASTEIAPKENSLTHSMMSKGENRITISLPNRAEIV